MNFRVNLAVAFAAALSFACADKQAANPQLEEAFKAPPGMRVVGVYELNFSPVDTADGVQYAVEAVPVDKNGNPADGPQAVVVTGTLSAPTTANTGEGCGTVRHVRASMTVTNYTADPLTNVWADVTGTSLVGRDACNSDPFSLGAAPYDFTAADQVQGIWKYPDMAGATTLAVVGPPAVAPVAGGSGTKVWGFNVPAGVAGRFYFRIVAQPTLPAAYPADFAGPKSALTWTSTVGASTVIEICTANPGTSQDSALSPCPVAPVTAAVTGTVIPPVPPAVVSPGWAFSYLPSGLANGGLYYWRVKQVHAAGTSIFASAWAPFRYFAAGPSVGNLTVKANAVLNPSFSLMATWRSNFATTNTWFYLCQGPCPAVLPDALAVNQLNVLLQGPSLGAINPAGYSQYSEPIGGALVPALSGYLDSAISYQLLVFDYDGLNQPTTAALGSAASVTVTPVQDTPVVTVPTVPVPQVTPIVFSHRTPPWTLSWTTDASFGTTLVDICSPDCLTAPVGAGNEWTPLGGLVINGWPYGTFSMNLRPYLTDPRLTFAPMTSGQAFEVVIYNPDLYQVFGTSFFGTIQ